jgi:hypothetical protein
MAVLAQITRQPGSRALTLGIPVVAETAVGVHILLHTLAHDHSDLVPVQAVVQRRPRTVLNAMIRPQHLRFTL